MALVGFEPIIIGIILVVLFLWGPQKLPEIAKSIGLAKIELDKAKRELSSVTSFPALTELVPASPAPSGASDPLVVAAKSLGISTEGKTKEELVKEITDKTSKG